MIIFDLACICGATFEGWFQDRSDFKKQQSASDLVCPRCGSREIRKILSPISYQPSGREENTPLKPNHTGSVSQEEAEGALAILQEFIVENFEDVGTDLAREALKIHYRVSEPRNIRGYTTELEEKKLQEEGINLLTIPMPGKKEKTN